VAGASEGTDAAFAREIARSGIKLLLIARRQAPLDTLAEELRRDHSVEVRTLLLDLNIENAGQRILAAAADIEVGLNVANAGAGQGGTTFLDMPMQTIRDLIARDIFVTVEACQHFGRGMRERGRGGIVLTGSGAGLGGQPGLAVYSGVKAFVLNLAESLWSELREAGVDAIAIAAPVMETPALRASLGDRDLPGILPAEDVVRNMLRRAGALLRLLARGHRSRVRAPGLGATGCLRWSSSARRSSRRAERAQRGDSFAPGVDPPPSGSNMVTRVSPRCRGRRHGEIHAEFDSRLHASC
jgi:short-subunit dehydrogenase